MKRKSLLVLSSLFAGLTLIVAACDKPANNSGSFVNSGSGQGSSTGSGQGNSTGSGQGSNTGGEYVAPNVTLPEGSVTRKYNAKFDTMIDDFSADTVSGTLSSTGANFENKSAVHVILNSNDPAFPTSEGASIYKMGTGSYLIQDYDGIGFTIRVTKGTVDNSNLVLGLRGDDKWKLHEINLADAVDQDGDSLPALTSEWKDIVVSPINMLDDVKYEIKDGKEGEGAADPVGVLERILGFHLMARGNVNAEIEISSVFLVNGSTKVELDNFNRTNIDEADPAVCWWRNSTGTILPRHINLNGGSYVTPTVDENEHTNVVISVMGDTTGTTLTPVYSTGEGTAVAWSQLKDNNNNPIPNAVELFHPIAINLANSNINNLIGVKLSSTTDVSISNVFLTSFQDVAAVTSYPAIDNKNITMFDDFNRTQSGFNADYEASVNNQIIKDAGLNYALSYNNGDKITVANGCVTFDATSLGSDDWIAFKEGANKYNNQKYLVLSIKAIEDASINGLSLNIGNGEKKLAELYSAPGLLVPALGDTTYPYVTEDGYTYMIIDLEVSEIDPTKAADEAIEFFYRGTGKLMIDEIFYTNSWENYNVVNGYVELVGQPRDLTTYQYAANVAINDTTKYISMTLAGDGTADFRSVRFTDNYAAKNGWVLKNGTTIDGNTIIPTTPTVYEIDLEASGIEISEMIHLHLGGWDDSTGTITVTNFAALNKAPYTELVRSNNETNSDPELTNSDLSFYKYIWGGVNTNKAPYVTIVFASSNNTSLESFRLEHNGTTVWAKDGKLIDKNGNVIDSTTAIGEDGLTITIDLVASGFEIGTGNFDIHTGDKFVGSLTIVAVYAEFDVPPYSVILASRNN